MLSLKLGIGAKKNKLTCVNRQYLLFDGIDDYGQLNGVDNFAAMIGSDTDVMLLVKITIPEDYTSIGIYGLISGFMKPGNVENCILLRRYAVDSSYLYIGVGDSDFCRLNIAGDNSGVYYICVVAKYVSGSLTSKKCIIYRNGTEMAQTTLSTTHTSSDLFGLNRTSSHIKAGYDNIRLITGSLFDGTALNADGLAVWNSYLIDKIITPAAIDNEAMFCLEQATDLGGGQYLIPSNNPTYSILINNIEEGYGIIPIE